MTTPGLDYRLAILIAYAAFICWIATLLLAPDEWDIGYALFMFGMIAWSFVPIAVLCFGSKHRFALAIGALLNAIFGGILFYRTAFYAEPDPLNGAVFLFVPIYQLGFAAIWIGLVYGWAKITKRHNA